MKSFGSIDDEARNCKSIVELEEILAAEEGKKGLTNKKLIDRINQIDPYRQFHVSYKIKPFLNELIACPADEIFPVTHVSRGDVSFFVHGIFHGNPGNYPAQSVKRHIRKTMRFYSQPSESKDYFYEEGLGKIFHLSKSQEIRDFSSLIKLPSEEIKKSYFQRALSHFMLRSMIYIGGKTMASKARAIHAPVFPWEYFMVIMRQAMSEISAIVKPSEYYKIIQFPEPIGLEIQYIQEMREKVRTKNLNLTEVVEKKEYLGITDKLMKMPGNPTIPERSLWAARELLRLAEVHQLKEVHYLCGVLHESQIAFFLTHPNYSFDPLNRWMKEKNILEPENVH